ncbi:hypothetical protein EGW08_010486 [Elysia chlorotica]|uniref:Uncharacterized protein n=1 Tax=Elysia chlorotica TaxID=188477 RepID=A0A3S1BEF2_ELYCH|nr:hypothetical protein EGW08_010486 [Elysia chlorotica]
MQILLEGYGLDLDLNISRIGQVQGKIKKKIYFAKMNDLHVCRESSVSKFVLVKESRAVHIDLQPFLTQSHLGNGFQSSWFQSCHLHEVLSLIKSPLETALDEAGSLNVDNKKKTPSREFVLTGETVRIACTFKPQPEEDIFLASQKRSRINDGTKSPMRHCFCQLDMHPEKLLCYVCPRSNSSTLQLSQIVNAMPSSQQEDISKYFQPAAS